MRKITVVLVVFAVMTLLVSCSVKPELGTDNGNGEAASSAVSGGTAATPGVDTEGPQVVVLQVGDKYNEATDEVTNKTKNFSADTPSIHVSAGITGLKTGAPISGTLRVVEIKDADGTIIRDMDVLKVEDNAKSDETTMHFEYTAPDKGWPIGDYVVNIAVDSVQVDSVEITVK